MDGFIEGSFRAGAFDYIVGADSAGELFYHLDGILLGDVDDAVRAEFLADREAFVARSR